MMGLITEVLNWNRLKNKPTSVVKRYLWLKHKISIPISLLNKRISNIKVLKRYD
jgi:hypothetical protein